MTFFDIQQAKLNGQFLLKGEFLAGEYGRSAILERSVQYAGWTLPTVFPDDTLGYEEEMQNDFQSVGAMAVTNLANKIMMALFQPSRPFFRMQLTDKQKEELVSGGTPLAKIDEALAAAERAAMRELDKINARVVMTQVIQHLIITGNSMLYMPKDGRMQNYTLRDYVLTRDLSGLPIKMILRECKAVVGLPPDLREIALAKGYLDEDDVSLYTGVLKIATGKFMVWQELEDIAYAHEVVGHYDADDLPWIPLTWNLCRNKDYGTGLVENYAGDFFTLSTLAESILDYTVILTDVKNLVNPAGMTDVRELAQTKSGGYCAGREDDIYVHTPNVGAAHDFLTTQFQAVERRIGAAFLLNSAVTRDAERVTAEEIRQQANELESSLGGVYSNLATELQLPLAKRLLSKLDKTFKDIEPVIVTGLESLSRNSELDRTRAFFQDLLGLADVPEQVAMRIDYNNLISILGAGHGVDVQKFLKAEEVVKSEQEARMKAQAAQAGMEAGAVAQGQNAAQPQ